MLSGRHKYLGCGSRASSSDSGNLQLMNMYVLQLQDKHWRCGCGCVLGLCSGLVRWACALGLCAGLLRHKSYEVAECANETSMRRGS